MLIGWPNVLTPVADTVLAEMLPTFQDVYANPASIQHSQGRHAASLVTIARERVAAAFDVPQGRIAFTSGSTESLNLAIRGFRYGTGRPRVLVAATEHKAVLEAAKDSGQPCGTVAVHSNGIIDLDALREALDDTVALVCVMAVNNETGVINPISDVADIVHESGALLVCDATQAIGRLPLQDVAAAELVAFSGHKIYGPKGVGALVGTRTALRSLDPILSGGGQEHGLRNGTLNTPGIVGLGAAVELVNSDLATEVPRQRMLRDRLHDGLRRQLDGVGFNGDSDRRVCNTVNLSFSGADGQAILSNLRCTAASSGSACQSSVPAPSHVLAAMGLSPTLAEQSLRFSVGRPTTEEHIDTAVADITAAVRHVRELEGHAPT